MNLEKENKIESLLDESNKLKKEIKDSKNQIIILENDLKKLNEDYEQKLTKLK